MLMNNDMLFWEFFVNLSAIIRVMMINKVMIISLIISKFLLKQFQKE